MFEILTVYHGSTLEISQPKVDVGRPNLDFGPGFYVTDIYSQAKDWAIKVSNSQETQPIINRYLLKREKFVSNSRHLIFPEYNKDWLDFVTASRLGRSPWKNYDYIEGGVADDRVVNTIRLYMTGFISYEDALKRLKYFRPANQICILNQSLLEKYLTFVESEIIDNE